MPGNRADSQRRNRQKETLNKNQKINSRDEEEKEQKFADYQEQINSMQKAFWNYLRSKNRIKDVEMEQEIYFEHLELEILEMDKNVVTNKQLNFAFA